MLHLKLQEKDEEQQKSSFFRFQTSSQEEIQQPKACSEQPKLQLSSQIDQNMEESKEAEVRVSTIHARLQQEADKIRQWKTAMEIELKQAEKKLIDSKEIMQSQSDSIQELQLQNCDLASKLQEEMENRSEILQKIETTRSLCNVLQERSSVFNQKLVQCEQDKQELRSAQTQQVHLYEELSESFKSLTLDHKNHVNRTNDKMAQDTVGFENTIQRYKNEKSLLESEHISLKNELENKSKTIQELEMKLLDNNQKINQLQANYCEKEAKLTEVSQNVCDLQKQLNSANETLGTNSISILELEKSKTTLEQNCRNFEKKQKEMEMLNSELKTEFDELSENRNKLCEKIMELNETVSKKKIEIERLTSSLNETQKVAQHCNEIERKLEDSEKNHLEYSKKVQQELEELENNRDGIEHDKKKLQQVNDQKEVEISRLKEDLKKSVEQEIINRKKLDTVKLQIQEIGKEKTALIKILEETKRAVKNLESTVNENEKELLILKSDLQKSEEKLQVTVEKSEKVSSELDERKKVEGIMESASQAKSKKLQSELDGVLKQNNRLENKNKTLQEQSKNKAQQIKELQAELRSSKSKVTSQSKSSNALQEEIAILKSQLKEEIQQKEENAKQLDTKIQELHLKDKCVGQSEKESQKWKKEADTAIKENQEAQIMFEYKVKEASVTLEKYKIENEKLVAIKDQKINDLKEELEKQKRVDNTKKSKEEILLLKGEVKTLTENMQKLSEDNKLLKKQLETEKAEKEELEINIKTAEAKLQEFTTADQSICTQTSILKTPLGMQPDQLYRTPKQAILKCVDPVPKRRRVSFTTPQTLNDCSDSDSSASQLMELRIGDLMEKTQMKCKALSNASKLSLSSNRTTTAKSLKKYPPKKKNSRGLSQEAVPSTPYLFDDNEDGDRLKENYREDFKVKGKNLKKAPTKSSNIKKTKQREATANLKVGKSKAKAKSKANEDDSTAWFDSDAVFGFFEEGV